MSFTLASLEVSGFGVPLQIGDLVVVRHEGGPELDWELVATTLPIDAYPLEPHQLTMVVVEEGRLLRGDAVVVRSDDRRHVFRGIGPLEGLTETDGLVGPP